MVFYRKRPYRRFFKRKRYLKKKINPGVLALSKIKKMIQMKYIDLDLAQAPASDAPYVASLVAVAQDASDDGRIGDAILVHSIHIRGFYTLQADATSYQRQLIVVDRQQVSSTAPTMSNVLDTDTVIANLALTTAGRFQVLWDRVDTMMPLSADANSKKYFHKYIKLRKPISVRYNGTASTTVQKNGIYWMGVSDRAAAATPANVELNIRVGYTDA